MKPAFTFGDNWLAYSGILDPSRVDRATTSVAGLVGPTGLQHRSFVDVGAGSGLFSIAAIRLGAARVLALDRDPGCVTAIHRNASRFLTDLEAARLEVRQADVLDPPTLPAEQFDVVYAWGSLHHTGRLWDAVANVTPLSRPGGQLALAIYNQTWFTPHWLTIKRLYHRAPPAVRIGMAAALTAPRATVRLLRLRHPLRVERGMSVWFDSIDWLGGLPYEAASAAEVTRRLRAVGFDLERSHLTTRHGCNEFVFRRAEGGR